MVEKNIALQRVINKQKNFDRSLKQDPFSRIIGSSDVFSRTVSQAQQAAKNRFFRNVDRQYRQWKRNFCPSDP